MKGQMETKYGTISINTDVIATYAGSVAVECFGIVGMHDVCRFHHKKCIK